jgi:hypothetical protein
LSGLACAGSSYAVMGVGQKMIVKLLGHIDTGATERYTHVQVARTKPLVEARWAGLIQTNTGVRIDRNSSPQQTRPNV